MKHLGIKIIVLVLTLTIGVFTFWLVKFRLNSNVYSISFCNLMRESKSYNGKLIEINASYQQGYEASFLRDFDCEGSITMTCSANLDTASCNKIYDSIDKIIANSSQEKFTVVGWYYDSKYDSYDGYVHFIEILEVRDTSISKTNQ